MKEQVSTSRALLPKLTDRLPLGRSGLEVSPICLGITTSETVPAAFDAGINFFFVSNDLHWRYYEPLMRGIDNLLANGVRRDDIVVAGVSYLAEPLFGYLQFNEMLEAMPRLERVDVLVSGASTAEDFMARWKQIDKARTSARWGCSAIGASFHDRYAGRMAIASDMLDMAYIRYNPGHTGAQDDLFPHIRNDRDCLVFNFKSTFYHLSDQELTDMGVGEEFHRPHITDAYRFALGRPEIDGALVALQQPTQVSELADALARGPLDDEDINYMVDLAKLARGEVVIEES